MSKAAIAQSSSRHRSRCAIYTRKSSEEGLGQDFNSLEAQREACEAFIKSQAHEGWHAIGTRFDDGGFSGGTLERPALQRLLTEIKQGRVDVVVIYKIDRLSRSLMDFARLAELFDAHRVSFVAVTQPFNTTTSMGRLMLNVLLSFAQFEREITGERIRDKVAASKKKGMWMGGHVPLGYDAQDRTLVINEREAEVVRAIYRLYIQHNCVRRVQAEAAALGLVSRQRALSSGRAVGGIPFGRGHLYRILNNPLYIGRIPHKGQSYEGSHPALIDQPTWDAVQAGLARNSHLHRARTNHRSPSPLAGLVRDEKGARFRATQTAARGKHYRYYSHPDVVEGTKREGVPLRHVPARDLEQAVLAQVDKQLLSPAAVAEVLGDSIDGRDLAVISRQLGSLRQRIQPASPGLIETLQILLRQIVLVPNSVRVQISRQGLRSLLALPTYPREGADGDYFEITVPVSMHSRMGQVRLMIEPTGNSPSRMDPALIRTLSRARRWWDQLESGQARSVRDIAAAEQLSGSFVTRVLRLTFLAPDIVEAILRGDQPRTLSARRLIQRPPLPLDWAEQRRELGFPPLG